MGMVLEIINRHLPLLLATFHPHHASPPPPTRRKKTDPVPTLNPNPNPSPNPTPSILLSLRPLAIPSPQLPSPPVAPLPPCVVGFLSSQVAALSIVDELGFLIGALWWGIEGYIATPCLSL